MIGEVIALGVLGLVLSVIGIRALVRGRIRFGGGASELLLKTPPTERAGRWARALGALITLLGVFFLFAAASTALR